MSYAIKLEQTLRCDNKTPDLHMWYVWGGTKKESLNIIEVKMMIEMLMENTLQSFSSDVDIYLSSVPIMQLHYCTI